MSRTAHHTPLGRRADAAAAHPDAPRGWSAAVTWNSVLVLRYPASELVVSGRRPIPERRRRSFAIYSYDRAYRDTVAVWSTVFGRAARSACRRTLSEISAEATAALRVAADREGEANVDDCGCVGRCWCVLDDLPVVEPYRPRGAAFW
jgi:hypothetical protein